ncbi:MAG: DUF2207 domain-containing protein [Candidatus Nanopelagicales bacterium]|jgi:hypothetical protein|nr:DUF2207 domain-containing protein [Actinomycetota bacterium]HNL52670.1 DUF2207 domain-containing protein [Actinomycetota bacterium]
MRIPKFRLFLVLLLLAAVVAGWRGVYPVPLKTAFGGGGEAPTDTSILDNYSAQFTLSPAGVLVSTELLDVEFTQYGKHGIYRIFDTQDAQYSNVQHPVEVLKVDREEGGNWIPEPYEVTQNGGGTMTIRIGSPYRTFEPGIQRYRIVSSTDNAITKPKDGPEGASSQWYWDVVGSGWAMPMRAVEVTAQMPPSVEPPVCEASVPCEIQDSGSGYTINLQNLPAYTPVTMKAFFAENAPGLQRTPWQNIVLFSTLGFVGLSLALTGSTFARSRERRPAITPHFEPPGPDPLTCAWTLDEAPAGRGVPAVLLNLVAHGVVEFTAEERTATSDDGPAWIKLTRTTAPVPDLMGFPEALTRLGLTTPGSQRFISKTSAEDGKVLSALDGDITGQTDDKVIRDGYATRVGGSGWALLLAYLAIIGGFSALIWMTSGMVVATLLLVAAAASLLINRRDTTRLTDRGSAVRDATAGFKQVLSTPASTERFDYAARVRHFDEYLPWAVAFDCADEWAESCTPPPGSPEASAMAGTSTFYTSPTTTSRMWAMSTGVAAVEASAVAAYQATQRSSSSSGGGGGGGGGGGSGGGGGGSW